MKTSAVGKFHTGKGSCHASHHRYFKSAHLALMPHVWGALLTKMEKNDTAFFRKTFTIHHSQENEDWNVTASQ